MATFKTNHYAQQETAAGNMGRQVKAPSGTLEFRAVEYELPAGLVTSDLVYIGKLPVGSTVVPSLCSVVCQVPGTTMTLDIGTVEDTDLLADGIDIKEGGRIEFTSGTMPAGALALTKVASTDVYATLVSVAAPTTGAKVVFNLAWMTAR